MLLDSLASSLIIIDVQEKLMPAISNRYQVVSNCIKLISAAHNLNIPMVMTEQYSKGLGLTLGAVSDAAHGQAQIMDKTSFSAMKDETFKTYIAEISAPDRSSFVLAGCEAHICVMQTALDMAKEGYNIFVVYDAMGSREDLSREVAINRMRANGIHIVTTEMVIFEWIERYDCTAFKSLFNLID